jgi:hypothetical protein
MDKEVEEGIHVSLPVKMSAIHSVERGLARIHLSHMDMFEGEEHPMAVLTNGKKSVVVKIVSDRLAPTGYITLRSKDMEALDVKDGEEVQLSPYSTLTEDLKSSWRKFKERHRKKEEEEEGDV